MLMVLLILSVSAYDNDKRIITSLEDNKKHTPNKSEPESEPVKDAACKPKKNEEY
jgi:hypothetical protein